MKKFCFLLIFVFSFLFIITGCTETPENFEISVFVNGANFGTVEDVSGEYQEGTEVTITAKPYAGQTFFCWLHENQIASTDISYTFTISNETSGSYVALFKCPDLEYIYLDGFSLVNTVATMNGDASQLLKEVTIMIGYNQNELITVCTYTDEAVLNSENIQVLGETLYLENKQPFAFDKTNDIHIKVVAKYLTTSGDAELDYVSESKFVLPKSNDLSINSTINSIVNQQLELTKNTVNQNLPSLETDEINSTISITFKKLADFPFPTEEETDNGEE